jgi:hypothetical protein
MFKYPDKISRRGFVRSIATAGAAAAHGLSAVKSLWASNSQGIQIGLLNLDPASGNLSLISNLHANKEYLLRKWGFAIQLEDRELSSESAGKASLKRAMETAQVTYDYPDYEVVLIVQPVSVHGFTEYVLKVRHKEKMSFYVRRVTCGEFQFRDSFQQVILHTDGTILGTPINFFLRETEGGIILGLAYPYQELEGDDERSSFRLGYEVEAPVAAGHEFETEPLFIGTYRYEGIGIFKPPNKFPYRFVTPNPEERDLGEIWTMQDYVRTKVPYYSVQGEKQLHMFLNAWWAGLPIAKLRPAIDLMAELGVRDVGTRETYYGLCEHMAQCTQLEDLPPGYQIQLPEVARKIIAYGKSKGVGLITYCTPCRAFRPEWEMRDKNGNPIMYGEVRSVCLASREAAEFTVRLWDNMLKQARADAYGFDGRILTSYNTVDLDVGPIGPLPCYAENHGHKPGHNFYLDYKNGQHLIAELRSRNPQMFLEVYWGLKRTYPWGLSSFNGCENYYESNGPQDDRMQSWYNQNYRFLPNYINFAQVRGYTNPDIRKEILSALSISSHLQLGVGEKILNRPENQDFFRKWTGWANENHPYLNVKRDLFGQPWSIPLDGSAHMLRDRGHIFLFNECVTDMVGSIPLNEWIGLTEGHAFDIKQIYPREQGLGIRVKRGNSVLLPVEASGAAVFSVEPSDSLASSLPEIIWHDLPGARVSLAKGDLRIEELEGLQGQHREIVVMTNGALPRRLWVNGQSVPFTTRGNIVLGMVAFGTTLPPRVIPNQELWEVEKNKLDERGTLVVDDTAPVISRRKFGSGVYEVDILCEFNLGGFFWKADSEKRQQGVMGTAILTWYKPIDGNIGLWNASFQQFLITWTLGENLGPGHSYRFCVESYGDRHSFSILNPKDGRRLAGPVAYRVETVKQEGVCGIQLRKGRASVTRFAFAPAASTRTIRPLETRPDQLLLDAFTSRTITRKMGQCAPPTMRWPIGRATATGFKYTKDQRKIRGCK